MKVIIAGSRTFNDYDFLKEKLDILFRNVKHIEIVSGCAKGADSLGERYAKENNINVKKFLAEWNRYGNQAGYLRNKQMAEYADACVVFWDGKSKGYKHMIKLSHLYNLQLRVIKF